jgi:hypothetical protein
MSRDTDEILHVTPATAPFGLLAILGVSFWFFLAFPFANHNESYRWIVLLNTLGLSDWVGKGVVATTFRPLGQATAWLSYWLSDGSIYLIQLLNYAVSAAAWLLTFSSIREKRAFGLIALCVGGVFFSGYIYLFHIHGVFYGPVLLLTAALLRLSGKSVATGISIFWVTGLSIVFSLYHPFSLLVCLAFLVGLALDARPTLKRIHYLLAGSAVLICLGSIRVLESSATPPWAVENFLGFLTSYRMVEVHPVVSVASFVFAVLTVVSVSLPWRTRAVWLGSCVALVVTFRSLGVPVILVWVLVCFAKMIHLKDWPVAFIVLGTSLLPATTSVGTPTYTVFVFMVCSFALASDWSVLESWLELVSGRTAFLLCFVPILLLVALRLGADVPIISKLSKPILAEKEKTFQLEAIIEWMMASPYAADELTLGQTHGTPLEAGDEAIDRTHRPPTSYFYLKKYISWRRTQAPVHSSSTWASKGTLTVFFGGQELEGAEPLFWVIGDFAGTANVYRLPR